MSQQSRNATDSDVYHSVVSASKHEIKVKGSRFIAQVLPATDAEGALALITGIRKKAYTATHHCTAYRVGEAGDVFRYNDDGEPSGTAGLPILRQIDARSLTNTLVVVRRYYGGTKLGTGGLIRAYGDAASEGLDQATIAKHIVRENVQVRFAYDDTSPAMHTIQQFDIKITGTDYGNDTGLMLAIRRSQVDTFVALFTERLHGRGLVVGDAS